MPLSRSGMAENQVNKRVISVGGTSRARYLTYQDREVSPAGTSVIDVIWFKRASFVQRIAREKIRYLKRNALGSTNSPRRIVL